MRIIKEGITKFDLNRDAFDAYLIKLKNKEVEEGCYYMNKPMSELATMPHRTIKKGDYYKDEIYDFGKDQPEGCRYLVREMKYNGYSWIKTKMYWRD